MINLHQTRLLGHRGARGEQLENTLFGFEYAKRLQARGLSGIEFDVQLTFDGHLIVFHDDTLQRLCGSQSRIDQLSLNEISRQLQSGHPIITLDVLIDLLSQSPLIAQPPTTNFSHIELEIKTHSRTNYAKLISALARAFDCAAIHQLPLVLTSFDVQLLQGLYRHNLLNAVPRGLLVRDPLLLNHATNTAMQLGCCQLGVYYPLLTDALIKRYHRYHLAVSAWTVNDIDAIRQLIDWQVDVIITDIPTQLL